MRESLCLVAVFSSSAEGRRASHAEAAEWDPKTWLKS